jgi:ABC-type Na+ efflux pump permease subunit
MNPLVKKEIRLLLQSFLIGVALTFGNLFLKGEQVGFNALVVVVSFFSCSAIAVFMALNSFGAEISSGTFSMLLAQPISRRRIWWTKTLLLGAALLIGGLLWCLILYLRFEVLGHPRGLGDFEDIFIGTWLFLLVIYSGALWTVLLFRQMAAAFWFTILIPAALLMTVGYLEDYPDRVPTALVIVFTVYAIAGFWLARWLFLRAQDAQWTGGAIAMPEMRGLTRFQVSSGVRRIWRPRAALLIKELQLHQAQFVIAGVLALLHLGVIATRKLGHFPTNSSMEFVLETFWGLWLVMPMLVGAAAVAEERKLGTLESQLCLPVNRRRLFAAKFSVVLFLSVLLGVVIPLLLEGTRILPDVDFKFGQFYEFLGLFVDQIDHWLPVLTLAGIAAAIGAISFYASTFARNTLQALGPAVLGILGTWILLLVASQPERIVNYPLWRGWLVYLIGVPILTPTLIGLAFWNYQHVVAGWKTIRRYGFVLAAALALVTAATTTIYHRAWEKVTPFEPPHGAARLSLSNPATLRNQWDALFVRLPDRRMWTVDYILNNRAPRPLAWVLGDIGLTSLAGGHFLDGSNWLSVVRVWREQVGIKTDGTLWVSEHPEGFERSANGGWKTTTMGNLMRFGGETNWSSLAWDGSFMLLVKSDGTLWFWGVTNRDYKLKWPGFRAFTPWCLGAESNWAEVFQTDGPLCLRKTDGSAWTTWINDRNNQQTEELAPGFRIARLSLYEQGQWRSTTASRIAMGYHFGIRDDGTFRIWADQKLNKSTHTYELTATDLSLGNSTNWLGVAGRGEGIVTLKDDGTLWLWNFHHDDWRGWDPERDEHEMLATKPVRLGTHADWIAIASADGGISSLAADGSLWYWPLERPDYFYQFYSYGNGDGSHLEPLLDMSRKPVALGNIFTAR